MRVVIAGGHGQISRMLIRRLADAGHRAAGLIRNPDHEADVVAAGGEGVLFDLESSGAQALAPLVRGADAVVFAAGAGPGSTAARKLTVDRDGAITLADAAVIAGVRRYVLVSARAADEFDPDSDDVFQVYLRAKSEADAAVRARDLDWTIVRPGTLTDGGAVGTVQIADSTGGGTIPRADVADVVATCLVAGAGIGAQFEVVSGPTPIPQALDTLSR